MRPKKNKKLGIAFKDELVKVSGRSGVFKKKNLKESSWDDMLLPSCQPEVLEADISPWRVLALSVVILLAFFGLFIRLFNLQVLNGNYNRQLADSNRVRLKIIHAPRGVIYDRNGQVLAENKPGFRLGKNFVSGGKNLFITRDDALKLEAQEDPKFAELEIDNIRYYPYKEITSHILGYVGEISEEELKGSKNLANEIDILSLSNETNPLKYRMGDRVGRSGIEKIYESDLKGVDGAEIIEVDAQGKSLRALRTVEPIPGKNIYLSIDIGLQKATFEALKNGSLKAKSCCGAAVAQNPQTGEVLALVSYPSFDSNTFTDPQKGDEVSGYFRQAEAPLLNRVVAGVYPPGSTFKITSSLAGLSIGKINKTTRIEDTGVVNIGPYKYANWYFTQYGKTEGFVDVVKALQRSNDIFFYRLGEYVGEKELGKTAKMLGFGKKLGIDLPGEADGLIPTDEWKNENIGERWYPGDTLHMSIGQGYLLATPLQVLAQTSFVASNGNLIQPHLVTKITSHDDKVLKEFHPDPIVSNAFKETDLELVKIGLEAVPKDGGTAWPFFGFSIPTAGKTGTAEFGDPKGRTHAWYTTYAPVDNPNIALTVLVEAGGEGSSVAAPIVKEILTWYFNADKTNIKSLDITPISTNSAKSLGE